MKIKVMFLFLMLFSTSLLSVEPIENEIVYPLKNEKEYTDNFNNYLKLKNIEKIKYARERGEKENIFYFLILAVLFLPLIISITKKDRNKDKLISFLSSFPNIINLNFLLVINSLGEWGSLKHPVINEFLEGGNRYLTNTYFATIMIGVVTYIGLIRYSQKIYVHITLNLAVFIMLHIAFIAVGFVLSKLP